MNLYISKEEKKTIKKYLRHMGECLIIDINTIALNLGYSQTHFEDDICSYIINCEITKKMKSANGSKRFKHVLYITDTIKKETIENIRKFIIDNELKYDKIILLDIDNDMQNLHASVDYILPNLPHHDYLD